MHYPKISIVTPSFNQGHFLEETIRSVLDQGYPNLEYIIIDGGSKDQSISIIRKYSDQIKYWESKLDKGQSDAIIKGMQYCTGDIFNWLNSDDYLEPGALFKIAEAFSSEQTGMVAGMVRTFNNSEQSFIQNQKLSAPGLMRWYPGVQFVQPGVWLRRKHVLACGSIDPTFHYSFDWDLYIRYLNLFPVVKEIPNLLVHFRLHSDSKTCTVQEKFQKEEALIIRKIFTIPQFSSLHPHCQYKMQKEDWTKLLKELSHSKQSFPVKLLLVMANLLKYSKVSFSRQTLGAIRSFWLHKKM